MKAYKIHSLGREKRIEPITLVCISLSNQATHILLMKELYHLKIHISVFIYKQRLDAYSNQLTQILHSYLTPPVSRNPKKSRTTTSHLLLKPFIPETGTHTNEADACTPATCPRLTCQTSSSYA